MTSKRQLPFQTLREFLIHLGFSERRGTSSFIFEHPESETKLLFRLYSPKEKVDLKDLIVVRKMLDEKGVMERDNFEEWVYETAV
jgi:hypothetical protein